MSRADRIGRLVAAVLVLAGGAIHLKLYFDSYRHIDKVGPSFLLNAVASLAVAILLVAWRHWVPVLKPWMLSLSPRPWLRPCLLCPPASPLLPPTDHSDRGQTARR